MYDFAPSAANKNTVNDFLKNVHSNRKEKLVTRKLLMQHVWKTFRDIGPKCHTVVDIYDKCDKLRRWGSAQLEYKSFSIRHNLWMNQLWYSNVYVSYSKILTAESRVRWELHKLSTEYWVHEHCTQVIKQNSNTYSGRPALLSIRSALAAAAGPLKICRAMQVSRWKRAWFIAALKRLTFPQTFSIVQV